MSGYAGGPPYGAGGGYPPPPYGYRTNPVPPGEGFAVGCGCLVLLVAAVLLSWLIVPAMALTGLAAAGHCLYAYLSRLASAMGIGPRAAPAAIPPPPDRPSGRAEPAYTHYLFGPALVDLRHAAKTALPAPAEVARAYDLWIRRAFQDREPPWLMVPIGIMVWISMAFGVMAGVMAVGMLCVLQVTVVLALAITVLAAGQVLRVVDRAMRRVKGIRTRCQSCHLPVPFPSFECAAEGCGRRHRDVRPGRYGILKRWCGCGARLPTLLIMSGGAAMRARCPHCGETMSKGAGTMPEIVIPVLGAATTGKTRLMTALVMGLLEGPGGHGATTEFADEESENAYRGLADKLRAGVHTWKTIKARDAPLRAYSLHLRPPTGGPRLLHVFDAPGELVGKSELLRELRYMRAARTFLFTLDPLSIDAVWESLDPAERTRFAQLRSDAAPDFVFGQIVQNIEGLGVQTGRARLAVALTKDDLVRACPVLEDVGDGSDEIRRWLEGPAGLDGMVRAMRRSFDEVRFFRTSSWLTDGEIPDSVLDLSGWILVKEGLRVHHSA
ncbi:hypothetical protein Arub01_01240 [Actinomadura rubrobrunea]|uniref:Double-GTPase 2 domain-containing protein n=1 Tax=Actinomadura rubrobrunea TaxID=115335 RepID=A0A9W6UUP1_9ACTN|nr:hypothetical protein [Actinomadura rubrobrunea]GLW61880.1 hypothetical protein Arub01_01240 [Actinomadura rubrobrunea]